MQILVSSNPTNELASTLRIFGFILMVLWSVNSYGQEWSVYLEDETVKIEYASLNVFMDSLVGEQLIFKYSNKSNKKIKLKFIRRVRYSGSQFTRTYKQKFKLELEPQEVMQGKLTDGVKECTLLHLFVGWKKHERQLESFRIEKVDHSELK